MAHQPRKFKFSENVVLKNNEVVVTRSFQPNWFDRWTWLHYNEENDSVCCFICIPMNLHENQSTDEQY